MPTNLEIMNLLARKAGIPDLMSPGPIAPVAPPSVEPTGLAPQTRPQLPMIDPATAVAPPPDVEPNAAAMQAAALGMPMTQSQPPPDIAPQPAPTALNAPLIDPLEEQYRTNTEKRYNKGEWKLSNGEITHNPKKAAAHPNAEVITEPGKDRDKKWSTTDKILSAIAGWATGGIGGGIKAATDRNYFEKMGDEFEKARLLPEIQARQQIAQRNVAVENTRADNQYQTERLGEFRADRLRKTDDRRSRERTSRMNAVAGMWKNLGAVDFKNPKFAELKAAMGDANLPITDKDAKKNVKQIQDQRTGAWSLVLTDPVSGKDEVRPILDKDGKQFTSTPTVVMQGELGIFRQNDAQDFQASQAEKQRQFTAAMESAKINAQTAFKQMEAAQGRVKALESHRAKYITTFQKENGRPFRVGNPEDENLLNEYLNAVSGQ